MEIVTGFRGKPHVTAYKTGEFNIGIFGADEYVLSTGNKLEAQIVTNNRIDIKDGSICIQGRHAVIQKNIYDELIIENGTQNEKRIDLIVARYEKYPETGVESINTFVVTGIPHKDSPEVPKRTVGDIRNGDLLHEMPLYEVELNGINIVAVRPVFKLLANMTETQEMLEKLDNNAFEVIETEKYCVKKYKNGFFEANAKTSISNSELNFSQISQSGLHYAKITNIGIGIKATKVYGIDFCARNNGIIWTASPSINANMSAVDGFVVQYGVDATKVTDLYVSVTGRWK